MAIIKEFSCETHGVFESRFAVCPHGCVDVERIHTRAPGTVSRRTRNIDATLGGIASDYKLSDLSNKNGSLAASVDKYQPQAPAVPMDLQGAIASRMQALGSRFGGNFTPGPNGSFWRDNSAAQNQPKAKVKGHMDTISGVPNNIQVASVVQSACDANGKVIR